MVFLCSICMFFERFVFSFLISSSIRFMLYFLFLAYHFQFNCDFAFFIFKFLFAAVYVCFWFFFFFFFFHFSILWTRPSFSYFFRVGTKNLLQLQLKVSYIILSKQVVKAAVQSGCGAGLTKSPFGSRSFLMVAFPFPQFMEIISNLSSFKDIYDSNGWLLQRKIKILVIVVSFFLFDFFSRCFSVLVRNILYKPKS